MAPNFVPAVEQRILQGSIYLKGKDGKWYDQFGGIITNIDLLKAINSNQAKVDPVARGTVITVTGNTPVAPETRPVAPAPVEVVTPTENPKTSSSFGGSSGVVVADTDTGKSFVVSTLQPNFQTSSGQPARSLITRAQLNAQGIVTGSLEVYYRASVEEYNRVLRTHGEKFVASNSDGSVGGYVLLGFYRGEKFSPTVVARDPAAVSNGNAALAEGLSASVPKSDVEKILQGRATEEINKAGGLSSPSGTALLVQPFNPNSNPNQLGSAAKPISVGDSLLGKEISGFNNKTLEAFSGAVKDRLDTLNAKLANNTITPEELRELENLIATREGLLDEVKKRNPDCVLKQSDNSYSFIETPKCEQFLYTVVGKNLAALSEKKYSLPNPCGTSELSKINVELKNFFTTLKGIKKYGQLYINGAINKTQNLTNLIRNASTIIAAVLKGLINRFRDYILDLIRDAIEKVVDYLFINLAAQLKNSIIQKIVDQILCKFKDIIKGLKEMVVDFLFELIGKIVNAPFCAASQFTNALINNLGAEIDKAIGPVLDQISDVLGGISQFAGKLFDAIDFIVGFESFLCAAPNCPEITEYAAGPWGGPSKAEIDAFENFLSIPSTDQAIEGINNAINGIPIFGSTVGGILDSGGLDGKSGNIPSSITTCDTNPFKCGPPTVEFFGGGGAGAVGAAVVDTAGKILGVNLNFGGVGYSRPPYVTFMDSCGRGNFASGYTKIDDQGQVTEVVMVNNGSGYLNRPDGLTEFDDEEEEAFEQLVKEKVTDYVVCLKELQVVSTGVGYSVDDTITVTPEIPNLKAKVKMTEAGQILAIDVLEKACNLTTIPEVTINSLTGGGFEVRPVLEFTRIENFIASPDPVDLQNLVRVIDCVS